MLVRRREEGAWWLCAAVGFAPVSQFFPFEFPIGDRYLYFILPGLFGGVTLAATMLSNVCSKSNVGRGNRA